MMLLLASSSTYSTNSQIKVVEGDTLVLVRVERIKIANIKMAQRDSLISENVILHKLLSVKDSIIHNQTTIIANKCQEINILDQMLDKRIEIEEIYKLEIKELGKVINKMKYIGYGGLTFGLICLIFVL